MQGEGLGATCVHVIVLGSTMYFVCTCTYHVLVLGCCGDVLSCEPFLWPSNLRGTASLSRSPLDRPGYLAWVGEKGRGGERLRGVRREHSSRADGELKGPTRHFVCLHFVIGALSTNDLFKSLDVLRNHKVEMFQFPLT